MIKEGCIGDVTENIPQIW